ncbi:MAG: FHA domain-containing protein [Massilibacteroides sp.]|nr:FHA domain-containing protein [Massilibacteroides sp.]MDD3061913.1 FHA domain-containing protein [Massilibacteroides sp.]MDD4115688.1 FHA domain-containing protein [Massilibacteroides sp.]MDD4661333.1 FHA domain-containing protein [Massilibacteroides sp.]
MKRIFCPKCDHQLTFDEKKYPEAKALAFVCPACGRQFKIRLKQKNETDYTCGYIRVIENTFGFKQDFPLFLGENVIGRRNKDTEGVDIPIITSDPSMGRKHCIIDVQKNGDDSYTYTLRDFPSLTGTFVGNYCLRKNEQARVEGGTVISIGATTFILHEAGDNPEDE